MRWAVGAVPLVAVTVALLLLPLAAPTLRPAPVAGPPVLLAKATFPTPIKHVIVIFLENEEGASVLAQGPYEAYLAQKYAFAGQFYSVMHYSLPNYLAATSGYTSNSFHTVSVPNVGRLATAAGDSWKGYFESMPTNCDNLSNGTYDINHDPFVMYRNVLHPPTYCDQHVVNLSAWNTAVAGHSVPNYAFVVPNDTDNGHNTNIPTADAWLRGWLAPVINSSLFKTTTIFLLYDEGANNDTSGRDGGTGGGHVYFAAISPYARTNYTSNVSYDTFDLLTTTEWLLGLGHTGLNDDWDSHPPMTDLFQFPSNDGAGGAR